VTVGRSDQPPCSIQRLDEAPQEPANGSMDVLPTRGSKWRCGPVEFPDDPTWPSFWPHVTGCPVETATDHSFMWP
jgi:hypothetical protein